MTDDTQKGYSRCDKCGCRLKKVKKRPDSCTYSGVIYMNNKTGGKKNEQE